MGTLPLKRASDRMSRGVELAVFMAAVATVPHTILHQLGFSGPVVTAVDWILWSAFVFDFVGLLACGGFSAMLKPRGLAIGAIVALSFPILSPLMALSRLARLAFVSGTPET